MHLLGFGTRIHIENCTKSAFPSDNIHFRQDIQIPWTKSDQTA